MSADFASLMAAYPVSRMKRSSGKPVRNVGFCCCRVRRPVPGDVAKVAVAALREEGRVSGRGVALRLSSEVQFRRSCDSGRQGDL